jgi:hypothetical protein
MSNRGIMVIIAGNSFDVVQRVVNDLRTRDLPQSRELAELRCIKRKEKLKYADLLEFEYRASTKSSLVEARAEQWEWSPFEDELCRELQKVQAQYRDEGVFVAEYSYDADDIIGLEITGVKCWTLNVGDEDLATDVRFKADDDEGGGPM